MYTCKNIFPQTISLDSIHDKLNESSSEMTILVLTKQNKCQHNKTHAIKMLYTQTYMNFVRAKQAGQLGHNFLSHIHGIDIILIQTYWRDTELA